MSGFTESLDDTSPDRCLTAFSHCPLEIKTQSPWLTAYHTPKATMAFSDTNARHGVRDHTHVLLNVSTALGIVGNTQVLEICQKEPVNIFSDRQYAVQLGLYPFCTLRINNPLRVLVRTIQTALLSRACLWFFSHIPSHSKLPGILTKGNEKNNYNDKVSRPGTFGTS